MPPIPSGLVQLGPALRATELRDAGVHSDPDPVEPGSFTESLGAELRQRHDDRGVTRRDRPDSAVAAHDASRASSARRRPARSDTPDEAVAGPASTGSPVTAVTTPASPVQVRDDGGASSAASDAPSATLAGRALEPAPGAGPEGVLARAGTTGAPATAAMSATPAAPATTAAPATPAVPATAAVPATPAVPATAGLPATAAVSATPAVPGTPAIPAPTNAAPQAGAATPATPATPVTPARHTDVDPGDRVTRAAPAAPAAPQGADASTPRHGPSAARSATAAALATPTAPVAPPAGTTQTTEPADLPGAGGDSPAAGADLGAADADRRIARADRAAPTDGRPAAVSGSPDDPRSRSAITAGAQRLDEALPAGRPSDAAAPTNSITSAVPAAPSTEAAVASAERLLDRVVSHIRSVGTQADPALEARLQDPELGAVRVLVAGRTGEIVRAELFVADQRTADALSRAVDRTATSHGLAGIDLRIRTEPARGESGTAWSGSGSDAGRPGSDQRGWAGTPNGFDRGLDHGRRDSRTDTPRSPGPTTDLATPAIAAIRRRHPAAGSLDVRA